MAKSEPIEVEATVTTALPNAMFKLRLDNSRSREILGHVSGKMRKHFIRILPGDKVKVATLPLRPDPRPNRLPAEVTEISAPPSPSPETPEPISDSS